MKTITIKNRWNGSIIHDGEYESIYAAMADALKVGKTLSGADLSGADLEPMRVDFLAQVLTLPNELEFLRAAIVEGKIDGSTYSGECACLAGTMAHAKGISDYHGGEIKNGITFNSNPSSPRERFFLSINKGDTPENNGASALALLWTNETIAIRDNIRATAK